jgi:diguanylate cyclase (GGDEF)-like protein/PAS domain S-box-containing protein
LAATGIQLPGLQQLIALLSLKGPTMCNLDSQILLISNNERTGELVHSALSGFESGSRNVQWARRLSTGTALLGQGGFACILLDISPLNGNNLASLEQLLTMSPKTPILILGGDDQEAQAEEAVLHGARDYLLRAHLDGYSLSRALRNTGEFAAEVGKLSLERERALVTLNSIGDAVVSTDISGKVTYVNAAAEALTGWNREAAIGRSSADVFHIIDGITRKLAPDPLEAATYQNRSVGLGTNCILIRRDGHETAIEDSTAPIYDRTGRVVGAVIVFRDVTAARAMVAEISHAAQHDIVTDLPNRTLLKERISHSIALARRQHASIAVMFLDLDDFKRVNDTFGHAAGDTVLQMVSAQLSANVRASDTVSRQGGDEFIILLAQVAHSHDAATNAKKLLRALHSIRLAGAPDLRVNASIGISVFPEDGDDVETLIQSADTAMYSVKEGGGGTFQFFEKKMTLKAARA